MDAGTDRRAAGPAAAAVFDLGGVLIEWDPRRLYRKLFDGDEAAMEAFLGSVCTREWNEQQDAGQRFADGVAQLTGKFPEFAPLIEAYDSRWDEMLGGADEGSVALLAELRARGTPLYALTNWSAEKFPIARRRFDFLEWFDGIVVSGEVGVKKPDPRIFRLLIETHGLDPASAVYIDDAPANVAAAGAAGFRALHFESPGGLRADLERAGLL